MTLIILFHVIKKEKKQTTVQKVNFDKLHV